MKNYFAAAVWFVSTPLGNIMYGPNQNPQVTSKGHSLFNYLSDNQTTFFKSTLNDLKKLSADLKELRSNREFNLLQEATLLLQRDSYIKFIVTDDDIEQNHSIMYYFDESARQEFKSKLLPTIIKELDIQPSDYLMADVITNSPFVFLAGTDSDQSVKLINSILDSASPEELAQFKLYAPIALHAAVKTGAAETIKILIQRLGTNPNMRLENGDTLLHLACKTCRENICDAGTSDYMKDHSDQIKVLLKHGADPTFRNHAGELPEDYMDFWGAETVKKLLIESRSLREVQNQMLNLFVLQARNEELALPTELNQELVQTLYDKLSKRPKIN